MEESTSQIVPTAEQLRRYVEPVERVKMAKALIDHHRREMTRLASVRRDALRQLRAEHEVSTIAELVSLSPPQVYALLGERSKTLPDPTDWTLDRLVYELHVSAGQADRVARGVTRSIPLGQAGSSMLAEELDAAAKHLQRLQQLLLSQEELLEEIGHFGTGTFGWQADTPIPFVDPH